MRWESCGPPKSTPRPRARARAVVCLAAFACLTLALTAASSQAEINRDEFSDADVSMIVPPGWFFATQESYPGLLAVAVRRGQPGRMNLIATSVKAGVTAKSYCDKSRRALTQFGFKTQPPTLHEVGAYTLNSMGPEGKAQVRQAYRLHEGKIYVLTIAVPPNLMASYERGFDDALRSMHFKKHRVDPDPAASPDATFP